MDQKMAFGLAVGLAAYGILTDGDLISFEDALPPSLKMLAGLALAFTDGVVRMRPAWQLLIVSLVSIAVDCMKSSQQI